MIMKTLQIQKRENGPVLLSQKPHNGHGNIYTVLLENIENANKKYNNGVKPVFQSVQNGYTD